MSLVLFSEIIILRKLAEKICVKIMLTPIKIPNSPAKAYSLNIEAKNSINVGKNRFKP